MHLNQLRYFQVVAETLHFGRAATILNMSQPPLSKHIQKLEDELGVKLLERTKRSVNLTPSGAALLKQCRMIFSELSKTQSLVKRAARGECGELNIGYEECAVYSLLPRLMETLGKKYPDIHLQFVKMETAEQIKSLRTESIDVGILGLPVDAAGFEFKKLGAFPISVALSTRHPLASRQSLRLRDVAGERLILYSRPIRPDLIDLFDPYIKKHKLKPNIVFGTNDVSLMLAMAAANYGLAVVPNFHQGLTFPNVEFKKLAEPNLLLELGLAWRTEKSPALIKKVLECI